MSKLLVLEIPETDTELVPWLEHQLVGLELGTLVEQLTVLAQVDAKNSVTLPNNSVGPEHRIGQWKETTLRRVASDGLAALSPAQLRSLLVYPNDLFELQESVLGELDGHWANLLAQAESSYANRIPRLDQLAVTTETRAKTRSAKGSRVWLAAVVACAAVLVLSISLSWFYFRTPTVSIAKDWGWDRPGVFDSQASAADYLRQLATAADQWNATDRSTPQALHLRLLELQHACDTLLKESHEPLSNDDREWLLERCRAWRERVVEQIASLEDESKSFDEVRRASDEIIEKLVTALHTRADSLG